MTAAVLIVGSARTSIADFLTALLTVYIILVFAHIVLQLAFSLGMRIPYARWSSAVIGFLRDVVEPYLGLFRGFIPPAGPIDFSPFIAILLLTVVGLGIIIPLIHG
ncbi:MAG: YggT family protein [Solirubrobacteraceae bacterium]|jgi:uncharacterized protein YggT (Ycf19 family)|nr:YggT family protein [Solirubrobacteraceae bacterium]